LSYVFEAKLELNHSDGALSSQNSSLRVFFGHTRAGNARLAWDRMVSSVRDYFVAGKARVHHTEFQSRAEEAAEKGVISVESGEKAGPWLKPVPILLALCGG
jgi:hypothetical protein